ncbi:cytochrome P450 [Pseudanabaena sp. ABRG5-3]|uniref:cytochrome P450 n=1 Tax=Pseudanabaena sp. ABRG5-3 TaxID=685565 RepID=UPI000DC6F5CA|nr:cytochrome P450 [Pseudanabaena sp. ABRG5-3]BBC26498.1 cytochrome P450 [Pseudanabaena sp. ABRG5-3]
MIDNLWSREVNNIPLPPLVKGLPILGSSLELAKDNLGFFVKQYHEVGAIFRVRALNRQFTVIAGAEANQFVNQLGTEFLSGQDFWQDFCKELGTDNLLISLDGDRHLQQRRFLQPSYSRNSIIHAFPETIQLISDLTANLRSGQRVQVLPFFQQIICEQLGMLLADCSPSHYREDLVRFLQTALNVTVVKQLPSFLLWLPSYQRSQKRVLELAKLAIKKNRMAQTKRQKPNLIDDLIADSQQPHPLLSESEMIAAAVGPYLAGLDTVANTCSFMLYALLKSPEIMAKVIQEVDWLFQDGIPNAEGLRGLSALHGAVMETLRMYPVAAAIQRYAIADFTFKGFRVDAGTHVIIATTVPHFLPQYFPNPYTFDIDRFHPPRNEHKQNGAFAPFGVGAHLCLGNGLAEVQIMLTMAMLLHRFEFSLESPNYKIQPISNPTLSPSNRFYVRVQTRSTQRQK